MTSAKNTSPPKIPVSVITSTNPNRLTKSFHLRQGELQKSAGGVLVEGRVETAKVDGLSGFDKLLTALGPDQALAYGQPKIAPATLVTKDKFHEAGEPEGSLPRTAEMFSWNDGPGVLMLDHDPEPGDGAKRFDRDELVAALRQAVPGLENAAMLWWPSASSFIVNSKSGEQLTGLNSPRWHRNL